MRLIQKQVIKYQQLLAKLQQELEKLPSGCLYYRRGYFMHSDKGKEVGVTHNEVLLRQLARKKLLERWIKEIQANLSLKLCKSPQWQYTTMDEKLKSLPSAYQKLPREYFYHPSVEKFLSAPYTQNPFKEDKKDYKTRNGVWVRSRAEKMIGDLLEDFGLPYRYEVLFKAGKKSIYPDFIIINPFTGKIFIWEHYGALHELGYEKSMNDKMDLYRRNGYQLFKNLIATFEFDIRNAERLEEIIKDIILDGI